MVMSHQLAPGMVVSIEGKLYRIESATKVAVPKRAPHIKVKMKDLDSQKVSEKNFKLNQSVQDVALMQRQLEFLYLEGNDYLFLDIDALNQVLVPKKIIQGQVQYLKEGTEIAASFYGETIFSVEVPQFLEIMVARIDREDDEASSNTLKRAILETGAELDVPKFIEPGDVIKVDTKNNEYVQRV